MNSTERQVCQQMFRNNVPIEQIAEMRGHTIEALKKLLCPASVGTVTSAIKYTKPRPLEERKLSPFVEVTDPKLKAIINNALKPTVTISPLMSHDENEKIKEVISSAQPKTDNSNKKKNRTPELKAMWAEAGRKSWETRRLKQGLQVPVQKISIVEPVQSVQEQEKIQPEVIKANSSNTNTSTPSLSKIVRTVVKGAEEGTAKQRLEKVINELLEIYSKM